MTGLLTFAPLLIAGAGLCAGSYWLARWEAKVQYGPLVEAAQAVIRVRRAEARTSRDLRALAVALAAAVDWSLAEEEARRD